MTGFDVEAFVARLERLGMRLTAVPLAGGKIRVNRWRMLDAVAHAREIDEMWTAQVGDDPARMAMLAAHLAAPPAAARSGAPADRAASRQPA